MTYQDKIRSKLASKVFAKIGKTVTFKSKSSPVYNTRGELENSTLTSSSITIVPYDQLDRLGFKPTGNMTEGETYAAIPYTVTVAIGDQIVMESVTYQVVDVTPNYLPDNVVTIVRLSRIQP